MNAPTQAPSKELVALIAKVNARIPSSVTPGTRIEIHPSEWLTLADAASAHEPPASLDAADWRVRGAAWLRRQAEVQEQVNRECPAHAAAYESWRNAPIQLRLLAARLENGQRSPPLSVLSHPAAAVLFDGHAVWLAAGNVQSGDVTRVLDVIVKLIKDAEQPTVTKGDTHS